MKIHHCLLICLTLVTLGGSSRAVAAEAIFLAEVQLSSETGAGPTKPLAISNDGRWVLLSSRAPNLIASPVEGNNEEDLFLYDRVLHQPELISHRAFEPSRTANEPSNRPISKQAKMSPDGEWVIFTSRADDLIVGTSDDLFSEDAFLWQRSSGQLTLISHQVGRPLAAAGQSRAVALTPDGAFVLFESQATSLVAGVVDTNNSEDVFLFERSSGEVRLISTALPDGSGTTATGNRSSYGAALLAGGSQVLFSSNASDLVGGDDNQSSDVFLWQSAGITRPVAAPLGVGYFARTASADGSALVFVTSDLEVGVFDRKTNQLDLQTGTQPVAISSDGTRVLFDGRFGTTWVYDRPSSSLRCIGCIDPGSTFSTGRALSADGRWALFEYYKGSYRPFYFFDVYLYDFDQDSHLLLSRDEKGEPIPEGGSDSVMSVDAHFQAFASRGKVSPTWQDLNANLDTFFIELDQPGPEVLSRAVGPDPLAAGLGFYSLATGESAEGQDALFSGPSNLLHPELELVPGFAAYAYRIGTGQRRLLSPLLGQPDVPAPGWSAPLGLASDGRVLLQSDSESLVPGSATHTTDQLFLYSPLELSYRLITEKYGHPGEGIQETWSEPHFDPDLGRVVLSVPGNELVPGMMQSAVSQIVLCETNGEGCQLLSQATGDPLRGVNGPCREIRTSRELKRVAFSSSASNLVSGKSGSHDNAYIWREGLGVELLSSAAGSTGSEANGESNVNHLSDDGRFVLVTSDATNLLPNLVDFNQSSDVFVLDTEQGTRELVSSSALFPATAANGASEGQALSANGRFVLFTSTADDVIPGQIESAPLPDLYGENDLFLLDRATGQKTLLSHLPGEPLKAAGRAPFGLLSTDGTRALILSYGDDLVPGVLDRSSEYGTYLWDSADNKAELVSHHFADSKGSIYLILTNLPQRTFSGSTLLATTEASPEEEPALSDTNGFPDAYLILLPTLFRDGFESGDTSAWK